MAHQTLLANWSEAPQTDAAPEKEAAERTMRSTIVEILGLLGNLRVAHWQASTKTNEHKALGDLYESLDGMVDDFTEALMGMDRNRDMPSKTVTIAGGNGHEGILSKLQSAVAYLCTSSMEAKADDLANIAADMKQAVNKARYLLS